MLGWVVGIILGTAASCVVLLDGLPIAANPTLFLRERLAAKALGAAAAAVGFVGLFAAWLPLSTLTDPALVGFWALCFFAFLSSDDVD